ncbi:ATP-dependent DNA helicase RecG [Candidatus Desantisbacteria bacterium CG23_combo_of_CG06-09_8_20_14_all_40_23]|uniref:ATP-dependent DNA helicase RecG n=1 Tax=Candidatus Desantisbacteria bacterium CG23_combo_of_CG06-09_8_20_14_all_40_23 TaxID=1974550 RepID=A0A2H0AA04_9BACT|nr:MAG: ATP-dependent DNA helicase RecG [Candidatus Desantisbacteria bacterium CG23_combo_of_CG06-09_8_20_14_all_40_23]
MNVIDLIDIINAGENSKIEFKQKEIHQDSFAQEIVAFANTEGGSIIFGIRDNTSEIIGLTKQQTDAIDTQIANITTDLIKPFLQITTDTILIDNKILLIISVPKGSSKPYNIRGSIYIRQGSTKRPLSDTDEILRLYQSSGRLYADEMIIENTSINDIDLNKIESYFAAQKKKFNVVHEQLLINLGVLKDNKLTLGGLLFFGKNPQQYKPVFMIKAVSFFGNSIGGKEYKESLDLTGTIPELFDLGIRFFNNNLRHTQQEQNFNSVGILEISITAIEELLQNALIHRDYLRNAPVRLLIFDNHIEIISPGKLPNGLTIENIKLGNAVVRNNLLVSYCSKIMLYRGFGSGITRVMEEQPDTEFINDVDGEQFIVKIPRPEDNR